MGQVLTKKTRHDRLSPAAWMHWLSQPDIHHIVVCLRRYTHALHESKSKRYCSHSFAVRSLGNESIVSFQYSWLMTWGWPCNWARNGRGLRRMKLPLSHQPGVLKSYDTLIKRLRYVHHQDFSKQNCDYNPVCFCFRVRHVYISVDNQQCDRYPVATCFAFRQHATVIDDFVMNVSFN